MTIRGNTADTIIMDEYQNGETFIRQDKIHGEASYTEDSCEKNIYSPKHYHKMPFEPKDFCRANMTKEELVGAYKWNVQKYLWRKKSKDDLKKAMTYLQWWIELEEGNE